MSRTRSTPSTSSLPGLSECFEFLREAGLDTARLEHCRGLASELSVRFDDPDLTRAALLHALPGDFLGGLTGLSDGTRRILADWRALYELRPEEEPHPTRSFGGDPRALALIIYDYLDRMDPEGVVRRWAREFPRRGGRPQYPLPSLGLEDRSLLQRADKVIAPLARAWGFWLESRALRCSVLHHLNRERWDLLLEFVGEMRSAELGPSRHERIVRDALGASIEPWKVRWEWRDLVSISENLEGFRKTEWARALFLCGYVSVPCTHPAKAYQLLERLHANQDYRRRELSDFMGSPSASGYRAIHTKLVSADKSLGTLTSSVHLVLDDRAMTGDTYVDGPGLAALRCSRTVATESSIHVFTPTGERKTLPLGATVLDFAKSIHHEFLALADHAVLNRKDEVDLLHRVSDGDEIYLVKGSAPRPLPEGWEDVVPDGSRESIHDAYQRAWWGLLAKEGLRWLKGLLGRPEADDRLIRVLVDLATAEMTALGGLEQDRPPGWWLEQIALHFGQLAPPPGVFPALLDEQEARGLVALIEEKASHLLKIHQGAEIMAPDEVQGEVGDVHWCDVCKPDRDSELAATVIRGESGAALVVHRLGQSCAIGGIPLPRADHVALDQFFVVETNNGPGVAMDVLRVFQNEGVDLVEVVGRRLGPSWGVLRMEVDPVGRQEIHRIRDELAALESVQRVISPLDTKSALLEAALPPRQVVPRNPFYKPFPFVAGPVTVEDHLFYGRRQELEYLHGLLAIVQAPESDGGTMGFVNGPLRIGKTSLVRRFVLLLRRQAELAVVPVHLKARRGQRWSSLRRRLDGRLDEAFQEAALLWGVEPKLIKPGKLEERIEAITSLPGRPSVVLVVDEVHRLFGTCSRHDADLRAICAFRDFVERTPGVLVLWTGPTYGTRTFHKELSSILLSSQPLPVNPFTYEQALALLEARKLAIYHSISIDPDLARHIFDLTGGEPFWLAHLANIMWLRASQSSTRIVRFDRAMMENAKRDLLDKRELFATRIEPHAAAKSQSHAWRVASALARVQHRRSESDWGMTANEITAQLAAMDDALPVREVGQALQTLQDRGAVVLVDGEPQRWRVAFPLLVEYLELHQPPSSAG